VEQRQRQLSVLRHRSRKAHHWGQLPNLKRREKSSSQGEHSEISAGRDHVQTQGFSISGGTRSVGFRAGHVRAGELNDKISEGKKLESSPLRACDSTKRSHCLKTHTVTAIRPLPLTSLPFRLHPLTLFTYNSLPAINNGHQRIQRTCLFGL
jgi:hypothetical protein